MEPIGWNGPCLGRCVGGSFPQENLSVLRSRQEQPRPSRMPVEAIDGPTVLAKHRFRSGGYLSLTGCFEKAGGVPDHNHAVGGSRRDESVAVVFRSDEWHTPGDIGNNHIDGSGLVEPSRSKVVRNEKGFDELRAGRIQSNHLERIFTGSDGMATVWRQGNGRKRIWQLGERGNDRVVAIERGWARLHVVIYLLSSLGPRIQTSSQSKSSLVYLESSR